MSNYIDKYRQRLSRNGDNIGKVYSNNTIAFIESTFHASPTFRVLDVVSTEFPTITQIDARVVEVERMGSLREVLFRPHQGLNVGTYVKFDGETWIVSDIWGSVESTNLKAVVQKCNRKLKWIDKNSTTQEIDCIASQSPLGSKAMQGKYEIEFNKFDVSLPTGKLLVFVEKNNLTSTLELNQRFIFGGNTYEVIGIDDTTSVDKNGFGIIQLTTKVTTKQDADDFTNGIAHNDYNISVVDLPDDYSQTNGDDGLPPSDSTGGLIW